jgi:5-methylthioadenosine/S-adenosylhomocysteine deaminase
VVGRRPAKDEGTEADVTDKPPTRDILIGGGTVVTMDPLRRIIDDGAVLVRGREIAAVGRTADLRAASPSAEWLDATGGLVLPGLVNTHNHLFQTLLKGLGDDRPLYRWLREVTAPAAAELSADACEAAALHGAVEAIRSGTTTVVDFMYAHPRPGLTEAVVRGLERAGLRAIVARGFVTAGIELGVPPALVEPVEAALDDAADLVARYGRPELRVRIGIAPCLLWMVDEATLRAARAFADEYGVLVTYHLAETSFEVEYAERTYRAAETEVLERVGFLGPDLLAVHCTKLDAEDIARLAAHDVAVSHNPVSNMYLAAGIAPIPAMLDQGLRVGLATDGPASNNNQNMLHVLKAAALLHKVAREDPEAMTALRVLEMATVEGARAVGMGREIGSLEPGKRADVVVVRLAGPFIEPAHDPVSALVYAAVGTEVATVLVDGEILMRDGQLTGLDEEAILERSRRAAAELAGRAGLRSKLRRRDGGR